MQRLKAAGTDVDSLLKAIRLRGEVFKAEDISAKEDFSCQELRTGIIENIMPFFDSVTLLGNDGCIPFFRIENPATDSDSHVLSDNPYGCRDGEFLVPDFPVSRIPSDEKDADFIVKFIEKERKHLEIGDKRGVSAKEWEKASLEVYKTVDSGNPLVLSPPVERGDLEREIVSSSEALLYFNVHGDKKTNLWYGQEASYYPVLMSSSDITGAENSVVATEACYGALTDKRGHKDSMPMAFLKKGARAYVGSTTISYGPKQPPNQEADLIVKYFLQYFMKEIPLAQSLKNAKTDFSRKMIRTQGYLDEDDKKTLLQFVAYGMAGEKYVL
ncbi:hypothetical protein JXA84_02710 [candidate division WOR-3 bacterium]|nr:hypothetical protein [candidate division WOR-3 bacterium]